MLVVDKLYQQTDANTIEYKYLSQSNEEIGTVTLRDNEREIGKNWYCNDVGRALQQIFNLQELAHTQKPILILETERQVMNAQVIFPELCCISYLFGIDQISPSDVHYLHDKRVYIMHSRTLSDETVKIIECRCDKLNVVTISNLDILLTQKNGFKQLRNILLKAAKTKKAFAVDSYPELKAYKSHFIVKDMSINLEHLLNHYQIDVKYNEMSREEEILIPGLSLLSDHKHKLQSNYIADLAVKHDMPISRLFEHLNTIALQHSYHPVKNWIESDKLASDNEFYKLLNCLDTTDSALTEILVKRWMISAVAMLYESISAQGVLVLQGAQSYFKTSFFEALVPINFNAIRTGHYLNPSKKDTLLAAIKHWIIELGELDATFKKSDISQLKAFITSSSDEIRRPYDRKSELFTRRTVFAGTVNDARFLVDDTGNRRWWTVELRSRINLCKLKSINMQQVWRYVYELYKKGEPHYLLSSELERLNTHNQEFEHIDPIIDALESKYDLSSTGAVYLTATEILESMGYVRPTKAETTRLACYLAKLGIAKGIGRQRRAYLMPHKLHRI